MDDGGKGPPREDKVGEVDLIVKKPVKAKCLNPSCPEQVARVEARPSNNSGDRPELQEKAGSTVINAARQVPGAPPFLWPKGRKPAGASRNQFKAPSSDSQVS